MLADLTGTPASGGGLKSAFVASDTDTFGLFLLHKPSSVLDRGTRHCAFSMAALHTSYLSLDWEAGKMLPSANVVDRDCNSPKCREEGRGGQSQCNASRPAPSPLHLLLNEGP